MEFVCSEFAVGVFNCSIFNTYSGSDRGGQPDFLGLQQLRKVQRRFSDRILVSAQQPKEEKCHKLWAAPYYVYNIPTYT